MECAHVIGLRKTCPTLFPPASINLEKFNEPARYVCQLCVSVLGENVYTHFAAIMRKDYSKKAFLKCSGIQLWAEKFPKLYCRFLKM